MDFKTFFVKKVMLSFYISVTFIVLAMAIVGLVFEPDIRMGYEAFFSPLIFGAIATFPKLITYSREELSVRQTLIRNILHFLLLEVLILGSLYFTEVLTSVSMTVSLAVTILIIYISVSAIMWISDKKTALEFNNALRIYQTSNLETSD
ncbi:hypothetical protein [Proteiniclasticum sp.]|uniref:hypothetical protein n=1 Tax=Proteiniclasticum sp. TaxID=2053595 RepID=UPI00289A8D5A|nr:hypothetical protein [Proteiniclasticum sp.]